MKRLPIVIMMIVAGSFLAFQTMGTGTKNPPNKYEEILKLVGRNAMPRHILVRRILMMIFRKRFLKSM